ncbi:MAG: S-methyl-5'-thioadenosine phosphorylase [Chloroflexota bacterium]|nr:S-methyl-5'-thioadenosine phosphorylase [Chloroflexota bacterium]
MRKTPSFAVIGGSGLYNMNGLENLQEFTLDTPFGAPSAPIMVGTLEGQQVAFLARHGIGHHINPGEINYRANIYALKSLGVKRVVSVSACGSLREDYAPGDIVIPDQLFDFTKGRESTFFTDGIVAHVDVADPFCPDMSQQVYNAVAETGATVHQGGDFITIEGPRFSTKAESNTFRSWGMSIIGMTTSPEAFLAREAELCYTVIAHVTDYDVWHINEEPVTVEMVIKTLTHNTKVAQDAICNLARGLNPMCDCKCSQSLSTAMITDPDVIPDETSERLNLLVDKYLSI